jgi:hypothetical protein
MQRTPKENNLLKAAELLIYLDDNDMIQLPNPRYRELKRDGAKPYYPKDVGQVEQLCAYIKVLRETKTLDPFLQQNFKNPNSRSLLDWIDEHDDQDRRREQAEQELVERDLEKEIVGRLRELPLGKREEILEILNQTVN